jgi:hypothetical protein
VADDRRVGAARSRVNCPMEAVINSATLCPGTAGHLADSRRRYRDGRGESLERVEQRVCATAGWPLCLACSFGLSPASQVSPTVRSAHELPLRCPSAFWPVGRSYWLCRWLSFTRDVPTTGVSRSPLQDHRHIPGLGRTVVAQYFRTLADRRRDATGVLLHEPWPLNRTLRASGVLLGGQSSRR